MISLPLNAWILSLEDDNSHQELRKMLCSIHVVVRGLGYLPGGHLPPPKFGHLPPPNSDISHPPKKTFAKRTTATPIFFLLFLVHFS